MSRKSDVHGFRKKLAAVNEVEIRVFCRDDSIGLKERAKKARQFFKSIGLSEISVRLPRGAWCLWVEIRFPGMDCDEKAHASVPRGKCEGCQYSHDTKLKLEEILQRAFPREIDESDMQTDYFRPAWTFYEM